jgi:trehalose 6-phosphate synthase
MHQRRDRLIIVSNRLPFVFNRDAEGKVRLQPGSGGLVSALAPVLRDRGGTWIGWLGTCESSADVDKAAVAASSECGYALWPVNLTAEEVHDFYQGFANEVIWPLFHDLQSSCNFEPAYWRAYCEVNRKFAKSVMEASTAADFVWVHDYQLMNVGAALRQMGCGSKLGFFLHIPFPPLDLFLKLPWRSQLIDALLSFDLIGFQTMRERRNFAECVRALRKGVEIQGKGHLLTANVHGREVRLGAFPIGIDFNGIARQAATSLVTTKMQELRGKLPGGKLLLGVDRLDYTKGIPHRLKAFHNVLTRYPQWREKISLIQVVVPSRVEIPEYEELKTTIEQMVGRINGEFVRPGDWVPVWYVYSSLGRAELLAYYRAADIALITPLKDGMNLVAKEYCASSIEADCVLILSEFAGAAVQLHRGALLVNPYDIEAVADEIKRACEMDVAERRARMRRLRRSIREHDIFRWVDSFLYAAFTRDLSSFPLSPDAIGDTRQSEFIPASRPASA